MQIVARLTLIFFTHFALNLELAVLFKKRRGYQGECNAQGKNWFVQARIRGHG